ncbi:nucleoside phosphorylase domain-containing protein [Aspergillus bertholletiae]|uniref:Nucleoside phosphorylase domain-containing protein n=1 Tax=Aspergillus bertholletiae TaxID=1226010 RepID=A0A5N7BIH1_9EURO|nr:nucleoside phosphorylase domain-containing protein [Aspergillus bertholletiae]
MLPLIAAASHVAMIDTYLNTDESDGEDFREIPPEDITIAIFCTLSHEAVVVKYSLDEELRCRPMAIVPNIRLALMVGVGADIPNLPSRDIRLGDITVSVPQDNHPGVVQYDFGKYERDGFVLKEPFNKPLSILISADGPVRKILRRITKKPRFKRPDTSDNLFKEDFHHINKGADCAGCLASSAANLVPRDTREQKHPVVHRGLILSGSSVVNNPQNRHCLRRDYTNAICFETGAAGIMDEIPCLVVRGISNYADTHQQDEWHYYAAAAAASYCKAL